MRHSYMKTPADLPSAVAHAFAAMPAATTPPASAGEGPARLSIRLNVSPEQAESLHRLRELFAAACNAVAPVAQQQRCWNRVALHHLVYRALREHFPQLGSQMACNAVYSVARTYRALLTSPQSPWSLERNPEAPLPNLRFLPGAPVYFDRHTLSLKGTSLSMFSLDGRLRFELGLSAQDAQLFARSQLREIVLFHTPAGYQLTFFFDAKDALPLADGDESLPEYVVVTSPAADS